SMSGQTIKVAEKAKASGARNGEKSDHLKTKWNDAETPEGRKVREGHPNGAGDKEIPQDDSELDVACAKSTNLMDPLRVEIISDYRIGT
ncbi:hypothetical protein HDU91_002814, partial [Kappamyces sp. JEL0680]